MSSFGVCSLQCVQTRSRREDVLKLSQTDRDRLVVLHQVQQGQLSPAPQEKGASGRLRRTGPNGHSEHRWLEARFGQKIVLIALIDDATSRRRRGPRTRFHRDRRAGDPRRLHLPLSQRAPPDRTGRCGGSRVTIEHRLDGSTHYRWRDNYLNPTPLPSNAPADHPRTRSKSPWLSRHGRHHRRKPAADHPWRRSARYPSGPVSAGPALRFGPALTGLIATQPQP
jgi:hypothetical protein